MIDYAKSNELAERARAAQTAGLIATAAALYKKAALCTPVNSFLRKARLSLARELASK